MATTERVAHGATAERLRARLAAGRATVGIIGLGYAGLPMAVAFAEAGLSTIGVDLRPDRLADLQAGRSYVGDVPDATVAALMADGRLRATADYAALAEADAITICVPTPLSKTKAPDIAAIVGAIGALAPHLRPGQLVVLESTSYPGTTEEILRPAIEARGLVVGADVFLAFAPERVDPGNARFGTRNTPKLVGGVTDACRDLAVALYRTIVDEVVPVASPIVAETAKLLENTFRAVNVALANEMALMCRELGVDVWAVIAAAATKPFGFMPFYPGPGLGGHCIPIVPHYLAWKLKTLGYEARFI
ncbi:MAG TPA: nucleotide sugar dehydrogenase, partial [Thermomicrobiales bacterium]